MTTESNTTSQSRPTGRPELYRPEFDERIVELAKEGLFLEEIAVEFEVCRKIMWQWTKRHPSFCNAYTRAKTIIVSKLMRKMYESCTDKFFNHRAIEFILNQMLRQMDRAALNIPGIASKDPKKRIEAVLEAAEGEGLRADEFRSVMDGLRAAFELENGNELLEVAELIKEKK